MVVIKLRLGNLKMALFHELQGFKKEKKITTKIWNFRRDNLHYYANFESSSKKQFTEKPTIVKVKGIQNTPRNFKYFFQM